MDQIQLQETPSQKTPVLVNIIFVVMLLLGLMWGVGAVVLLYAQGITILSVYLLLMAVGVIAISFGVRKMQNWGLYSFIGWAASAVIYDVYLLVAGGQINRIEVFIFLALYIAIITYLWRIYKKSSREWIVALVTAFLLAVILFIYPQKVIPVAVSPRLPARQQSSTAPVNQATPTPKAFSDSKAGYSVTLPVDCRPYNYVKVDSVHDPDIFLCGKGGTGSEVVIENSGSQAKDVDAAFQALKQAANNDNMKISEDKDFTYTGSDGKAITGKQMKEEYDLNKSHMKQWVVLLPTNDKNIIFKFMYTSVAGSYDTYKQDAADILNSWKIK